MRSFRSVAFLAIGLLLAAVTVTFAATEGAQPSPDPGGANSLVKTLREGFKDLMSATRNQEFLQTSLTGDRLEGLKAHLGRDMANRVPGLADAEGQTLKRFLEKNPNVATESPQVLTYLASVRRQQGVQLFADDRATEPLTIANPARVIGASDLSQFGTGPEGEERLKDYLKSNFNLDEAQVKAYGAFLKFASGGTGSGDPTNPGAGVFSQLLDRAAGAGSGGLYLPSREVLTTMSQVMTFYQEFAKNPGTDPSTFKGPDGRSLVELMTDLEPDPTKRRTLDDLRRMSPEDVRNQVMSLLEGIVRRDLDGPNRALIDMGIAWITPAGDSGGRRASTARTARGGKPAGILGNGRVRELNESLYKSLILDELTGMQRDQIEMESEGEFFSIRGRPGEIHQKHYDPPVDPDGLLFGTGMSLDNHKE